MRIWFWKAPKLQLHKLNNSVDFENCNCILKGIQEKIGAQVQLHKDNNCLRAENCNCISSIFRHRDDWTKKSLDRMRWRQHLFTFGHCGALVPSLAANGLIVMGPSCVNSLYPSAEESWEENDQNRGRETKCCTHLVPTSDLVVRSSWSPNIPEQFTDDRMTFRVDGTRPWWPSFTFSPFTGDWFTDFPLGSRAFFRSKNCDVAREPQGPKPRKNWTKKWLKSDFFGSASKWQKRGSK